MNKRQVAISSSQNQMLNQAIALHQAGKLDDAEQLYKKLLLSLPSLPTLLTNLGIIAFQRGCYEDGVQFIGKSLAIAPNQPSALNNLGLALVKLNRLDEAVGSFERAIAKKPNYDEAYSNLGNALMELNRLDEALKSFDRAITINPNYVEANFSRAVALQKLKRLDESVVSYDKAIAINPNNAELYFNRGFALQNLNRLDEALASYDKAITLNPNYVDAYCNKSLLKILNGEYLEGWELYEWRWKNEALINSFRVYLQPLWLGQQSITGKTLLIYPEQGLGDYIQCIRYAKLAVQREARVILELPSALISIASTFKGQFTLIEKGMTPPDFDYHCPIMSLPFAFKTTLETIPVEVPYLYADSDKQKEWRQRLGNKTKSRVGLVWSGSIEHKNDHNRSISFQALSSLFNLSIEFHCLQKEIRADDEAVIALNGKITIHKDYLVDFSDTAALIEEMDLVISVDTSVAHLAGALGKEVWILLPYAPDFRWMLEREDSSWYPTAKLFRQPAIGDWDSVINRIIKELVFSILPYR